jgi:hypothetical protein
MEACDKRMGVRGDTSIEVPLDSGINRGPLLALLTSISEVVHPSMASTTHNTLQCISFLFSSNRSHVSTFWSCYFYTLLYFENILANKMAGIRCHGNQSP